MSKNEAAERIDIFDELYNRQNQAPATFDEIHTKGLWHQTFACWLVNKEKGTVIMQLRGPKNIIDPGSFDSSAGGHLLAGEEHEDGFRELEEELGVNINKDSRFYLGMYRNVSVRGRYINNEFCHIYLALSNYSINDFVLEEGEVDGAFEVKIDDAIDLFLRKVNCIKALGINGELNLKIENMCNYKERIDVSNYYLESMKSAKNLIEGRFKGQASWKKK